MNDGEGSSLKMIYNITCSNPCLIEKSIKHAYYNHKNNNNVFILEDYISSTNRNLSNIWSSVKSNKKEHIYNTWQTISTNKRKQFKSRNHRDRRITANHRKPPQTTANHPKPLQTTFEICLLIWGAYEFASIK